MINEVNKIRQRSHLHYRKVGDINGVIIEEPVEPVVSVKDNAFSFEHREKKYFKNYTQKGKLKPSVATGQIINICV